ncbi:hypothetical protein D3C84_1089210 [compost metagenome]
MHLAFAEAMLGIVREHRAELFPAALAPEAHHVHVDLFIEFTGPVVDVGFGVAIIGETV